jgi:hypothetical protein
MNPGETLLTRLRHLADRGESGCLEVHQDPYSATIYIQDGDIVDADLHGRKGLDALFDLLNWEEPSFVWAKGVSPYQASMHLPIDELELRWREHMALGPPPGNAPQAIEVAGAHDEESGVALPALETYDVGFAAVDPLWRPSRYDLSRPLKPSYLIGSAPECDIRINHYSVRKQHCGILVEDGFIRMWDLGSHNATHVNGELTDQAILKSGDVLRVGDIELKLVFRLRRPGLADLPTPRPTQQAPQSETGPGPLKYETLRKPAGGPGLFHRIFGGKPGEPTPPEPKD